MTASTTIVHFKHLGSRHIHKEIKLQMAMNRMDMILCKTDLILIRRHTYKCNIFSYVYFEEFSKSAYILFWRSQFQQNRVSKGGGFLLCNDLDLIWFLSELNTSHKLSSFWAWIPRRLHVGHDNLKDELRVFPIIKSHWHFIFMKFIKRTSLKNLEKFTQMDNASVL